MSAPTSAGVLAEMTALLVQDREITDVVSRLTQECLRVLPVDAAAILVSEQSTGLQLLTATSHTATQLEIYQAMHESGPCVDTIELGTAVTAVGEDEIVGRWPEVGAAVVAAGFRSVHAIPLAWRGDAIGGLNLFGRGQDPWSEEDLSVAHSLADLATVAIARPGLGETSAIHARIREALEVRVRIEQAKGVLAQTEHLDMDAAYDALVERAATRSLGEVADAVLREAQRRD
ncbi:MULTISPECIES: GAF and ANTAR domain-containing protein [Sanguibacter]|jgi:GAF domain-containing protein|uniref:GAF and ANTAR domain-containing protein n=1 Tax=Sanguibacter inulinus TaxID=60922 RepID=A0A853ETP7_9MICO|nr:MULTISPECIES: GAF and ANTAR domain-containing protein [Sanguibacter]MBF0721608.1 GAF and ANTAR domain-containing protein [Sanguibacter inulinus]NYS92753.1 GAF and ANTAR domain-containing protein [Sanguibacter inulinus]